MMAPATDDPSIMTASRNHPTPSAMSLQHLGCCYRARLGRRRSERAAMTPPRRGRSFVNAAVSSAKISAMRTRGEAVLVCLLAVLVGGCGGGRSHAATVSRAASVSAPVAMRPVPSAARAACQRGWLLRPACPRSVPTSGPRPFGPYIVAGCSGGPHLKRVPLASKQCMFAEWSYLTEIAVPGMPDRGVHLISTLPAPPPYFVHVLVYGTTDPSKFGLAVPRGRPRPLSDRLLSSNHPHAILIRRLRWAGHGGELFLAPSYPGGGEMGGHLIFAYKTGQILRGISIHPWPAVYRYRVGQHVRSLKLAPSPAYPQIERTLHAIVDAAQ
jgi:hypothetical protein